MSRNPFINSAGELFFSSMDSPDMEGRIFSFQFIQIQLGLLLYALIHRLISEFDDFGIVTDTLNEGGIFFIKTETNSIDIYHFTINFSTSTL